jgi:hypothetical protein
MVFISQKSMRNSSVGFLLMLERGVVGSYLKFDLHSSDTVTRKKH